MTVVVSKPIGTFGLSHGPIIGLGQKVRDPLTGLVGVAICRSTYLYGCVRILVQPHGLTKDGAPLDCVWVDEPQLEIVAAKRVKQPAGSRAAGPRTDARRHMDARR